MLGLTEVTTGAQLFVRGLATGLGALLASSVASQTELVRDALGRGFGGNTPLLSSEMNLRFSVFLLCSLSLCSPFSSASLLSFMMGLKSCFGIAAVIFGTNVLIGIGLASAAFCFSSCSCFSFERGLLYT